MYTLAYADNVVLLAEEKGRMKSMIERLERYLDKKWLTLNMKTKVMRFRKGRKRMKKIDWRWKGVKEFVYLGYTFKRNGRQEAHIKDRECYGE